MATAARVTLDEFLSMRDDEKPAGEFACGEITRKPMPDRPHAAIQFFLAAMLFPFLERTGIGEAFTELRCIFGPLGRQRAYVPDLVYVAKDRLTSDRYLRTAPDLAVEVLSRNQDMTRLLDKIQFYLLNGVRLVWVIDPVKATIAVLAPGLEAKTLTSGDVLEGEDVLPGFSLKIEDIFARARR